MFGNILNRIGQGISGAYNSVRNFFGGGEQGGGSVPTPQVRSPQVGDYRSSQQYIARQKRDLLRSQQLLSQINNLQYQTTPRAYAPNLDISQLSAQARQTAEATVNPYFTRQLNEFVANQNQRRDQRAAAFDLTNRQLEATRQRAEQSAATGAQREREDLRSDILSGVDANDASQTASGRQFDVQNRQLQQGVAAGGTARSGIGQGQVQEAQQDRNIVEGEEQRQFRLQQSARNLLADRNLSDIQTTLGQTKEDISFKKEAESLDYNAFLEGLVFEESQKRQELEAQRLSQIFQTTQQNRTTLFSQFLGGIQDPAAREAAASVYGGLF